MSLPVIDAFLRKVHGGFDTMSSIEQGIWREILSHINEATVNGLLQAKAVPTHNEAFLSALRHSNEVFAAFKVHALQQEVAAKLLTPDGRLKSFAEFRRDVEGITSHQCGAWLQTEYDTAVIRAHNAADWQAYEANRDIMPNLRWLPTTAAEPEAGHRAYWVARLNLPMDDPFWQHHHPGDHWNCKCSLEQNNDPVCRPSDIPADPPQPGLDNNPGKDHHTFSDNHPYFPKGCTSCPFNKGVKNIARATFRNEKKHCYQCSKINLALPKDKESMKKISAEQKHEIYSMPINRQFEEVGKNVFKHVLKATDEEDYARLLDVANAYADKGMKVWILPEIHKSEVSIRKRIGLPSKTHTPDLWIDKKVLIDAKSPLNYKRIESNANGASEQGGIACITNHFIKLEPAKLADISKRILSNGMYTKDEVHFYIDGYLYKYNSQGIILG